MLPLVVVDTVHAEGRGAVPPQPLRPSPFPPRGRRGDVRSGHQRRQEHAAGTRFTATFFPGGDAETSSPAAGDGDACGAAATPFWLAMERVHRVSEEIGRVDPSDEDTSPSSNRNGFVVLGGCPFRAFHRERFYDDDSGDTSAHLARAMEDFSLSAIMGRMAELGSIERATASEAPEYGRWEEASCPASPSSGATPSQGRGDDPSSEAERRPPLPPLSRALKAGTVASHAAAEEVCFVKDYQ